MIVLWEELRCSVIQRSSLHALDLAVAGYETFRVVAYAEVEFVDDVGADHPGPVCRPPIVFVEVVRIDSPTIVVVTGPA